MNIFDIETEASRLRLILLKPIPARNKLLHLHNFFTLVENNGSVNLLESYLLEFAVTYTNLVADFDIKGTDPDLLQSIISQAEKLSSIFPEPANKSTLDAGIDQLRLRYEQLINIMNGGRTADKPDSLYMPLLIKDTDSVEGNYGLISSLSVQLKPCRDENKFHIIPSGLESDPSLKEQAADSLGNALRITAQYTKHKQKYWEIYIDFENKQGEYTGSSFGMLLVLKLVEEILRFYDSSTKIFSKSSAALSGQVDTRGNIPSLSEDIIRKKTRVVFYSDSPLFIVPEDDCLLQKTRSGS